MKSFLDLEKNEDILKENNGKKFDVVLMNPPYLGTNLGDNLYVDFINKCLEISNILCSINPDVVLLGHGTGGWARTWSAAISLTGTLRIGEKLRNKTEFIY